MELDHVFVRAKYDAPEAALLRQFGLAEGSRNKHPGQGTENRRFFFHNAFIEFLWIADEAETKAEETRPTMLYERLHADLLDVSPFGVCFRAAHGQELAPFPTWDYAPGYFPEGVTLGIGTGVPLSEPMWLFFKKGSAPASAAEERRQPLVHTAGLIAITSIAITTCGTNEWSAPALAAMNTGCISVAKGSDPLMEITFDNGRSRQRYDFRPALPLVFHY